MAQIISDPQDYPSSLHGAAVAVGNFDGVHRGHARLIAKLIDTAREVGGPAVVLTFDPPPQAVLVPDRPWPAPLTPIARRAELLGALGVEALVAAPTDQGLLSLSAREFFQRIIVDQLRAGAMVEGPNFRFGRDRAGDTRLLAELCQGAGIKFSVAEATQDAEGLISSSRIRGLLAAGDVASANGMLTQPYELTGLVGDGARRGRQLGFPTANLTQIKSLIPAHGVYAGSVQLQSKEFPAAVNIGPNPTFDDEQSKVEVHIIGWEGTLYGQLLSCKLMSRIRDVLKFSSLENLRNQIRKDIAAALPPVH